MHITMYINKNKKINTLSFVFPCVTPLHQITSDYNFQAAVAYLMETPPFVYQVLLSLSPFRQVVNNNDTCASKNRMLFIYLSYYHVCP